MRDDLYYIVIDGVPSSDFGVFVTNAGSFKIPKKDYDLKEVSGRNGAVYLDRGRFENVEIKYPAIVIGEFQRNYDDFIALLMSKKDYFRMEDTIRPDIYREALFVGDVDPKVTNDGEMGTFTITFLCKPQKFLKIGEKPIEITDSFEYYTYIKNPTMFPSSPIVQIYGYGTLKLNDYQISIANNLIGGVNVVDFTRWTGTEPLYCYFKPWLYNSGDNAWIQAAWWVKFWIAEAVPSSVTVEGVESLAESAIELLQVDSEGIIAVGVALRQSFSSFHIGTTSTIEVVSTVKVSYINQSTEQSEQQNITITMYVDIEEGYIVLRDLSVSSGIYVKETKQVEQVFVDSTASVLGNPLNVDMETGDAYKIEDGKKIYVNNAVWVGEKLPVLAPGDNPIEQDANMSKVVIIPRWWTI